MNFYTVYFMANKFDLIWFDLTTYCGWQHFHVNKKLPTHSAPNINVISIC